MATEPPGVPSVGDDGMLGPSPLILPGLGSWMLKWTEVPCGFSNGRVLGKLMGADLFLPLLCHRWPCYAAVHLAERSIMMLSALESPSKGHRWSRGTTSERGLVDAMAEAHLCQALKNRIISTD